MKGFTFIELLVVVSIVLTLSVMSSVFYSRFLTQNNVSNVQDQLLSSLRKAQIYAMMERRGGDWGVHYGSNKIVVFQGSTYAGRNAALDEFFDLAGTITITGFIDIIFTRITGLPSSSGIITISGPNNTTKQVIVNSEGVASRN